MKPLLKATLLTVFGAATLSAAILISRIPLAEANGTPGPRVELSETQRANIGQIMAQSRTQIQALLTPEQQAAFTAALGDDPRSLPRALRSLDLTDAQREQVRTIMMETRAQVDQILTPEQQQQWSEGRGPRGSEQRGPGHFAEQLASLDLTPEQRDQVQSILEARQGAIAARLTPEQRTAFLESWQSSQNLWQALQAANLTQDQRMELRDEMHSLRDEIMAVLTEEQRQQLQPPGRSGNRPHR